MKLNFTKKVKNKKFKKIKINKINEKTKNVILVKKKISHEIIV